MIASSRKTQYVIRFPFQIFPDRQEKYAILIFSQENPGTPDKETFECVGFVSLGVPVWKWD